MFRFAASTLPVTLRQMGLVAIACSVAALSACGGGNRAKAYQPDRIVSFGDENSMISSLDADGYTGTLVDNLNQHINLKGLTYTINSVAVDATSLYCASTSSTAPAECGVLTSPSTFTTASTQWAITAPASYPNRVTKIERDTGPVSQRTTATGYFCNANTLWIQVVAHGFGKGYVRNCPIDADGADTYATYGAKVADVIGQINTNRGTLGKGVLVTIMAGQNDILELFAQVQSASKSEDSATQELQARASSMANAVRDVIRTGAKVVLATTPDLGESPKAYGLSAGNKAVLQRMTAAFNKQLYITELGSTVKGRDLQGVQSDVFTNTGLRISGVDYTNTACNLTNIARPDGSTVQPGDPDENFAVKYCNATTLNSSTTTYIWADTIHVTPYLNSQIGSAAFNRAANSLTID